MLPELEYIRLLMIKKKNIIISFLAGIALIVLYVIIFSFSEQDSVQSGAISIGVSRKCINFLNDLFGGEWSELFMTDMAAFFEHPIRKLGHFTEYACMGILLYIMLRPFIEKKKLFIIIAVWVFLSAGADEIHQLYVPGRYGCIQDVCLDTIGGTFGFFVCKMIENIHKKRKLKKEKKKNTADA